MNEDGETWKHNDQTIIGVLKCQKPLPDYYGTIQQFLEDLTEQSSAMISLKTAGRRSSVMLRSGHLKIGHQFWQKGGEAKKRCQYCLNPNSSNQFLHLRAIQGHSWESAIDPALQDNVLLPKGFTEHIYQVGNASELNSTIGYGLILGGKSLKRGRQAVLERPTRHRHSQGNNMHHGSHFPAPIRHQ